jgi:hypothetical protein
MYTDASNGTQEADNAINHDIMTYEYNCGASLHLRRMRLLCRVDISLPSRETIQAMMNIP